MCAYPVDTSTAATPTLASHLHAAVQRSLALLQLAPPVEWAAVLGDLKAAADAATSGAAAPAAGAQQLPRGTGANATPAPAVPVAAGGSGGSMASGAGSVPTPAVAAVDRWVAITSLANDLAKSARRVESGARAC